MRRASVDPNYSSCGLTYELEEIPVGGGAVTSQSVTAQISRRTIMPLPSTVGPAFARHGGGDSRLLCPAPGTGRNLCGHRTGLPGLMPWCPFTKSVWPARGGRGGSPSTPGATSDRPARTWLTGGDPAEGYRTGPGRSAFYAGAGVDRPGLQTPPRTSWRWVPACPRQRSARGRRDDRPTTHPDRAGPLGRCRTPLGRGGRAVEEVEEALHRAACTHDMVLRSPVPHGRRCWLPRA